MILKKSVPFSGSPVLLSGTEFSNIQKFLLSGYASSELAMALGKPILQLKSAWTVIGAAGQLSHFLRQENQEKLILSLSGSAYILCIANERSDPVIFRLNSGTSEAVWVPKNYFQGFYFISPNSIILVAATEPRNDLIIETMDPTNPSNNIDLSQIATQRVNTSPLVCV